MRKYDDYTCPKYGIIIYPDWDDRRKDGRRKRTKRIRCEVCGAWCSHLVRHLNKIHGLDIEPNMPPRAANELALKKSKTKVPADKKNRIYVVAKASSRSNKKETVPLKTKKHSPVVRYVHCPVCDDMFISDKERDVHVIHSHLQHCEGGKVRCPVCRNIMDASDGYREVISHIAICKGQNTLRKRR